MITPGELRSNCSQYTGTDQYYYNQLNKNIKYTDGAKYFFTAAEAYWFLDIILTEIVKKAAKWTAQEGDTFFCIKLISKDGKAKITAESNNGAGKNMVMYTKNIDFTDCPEGEWKMYFTNNVILLPSEY